MHTKTTSIAELRADQRRWRELAREVGPERYAAPGPMGDWSFGDMAGHLLGWRERTIRLVEAIARSEPEPAPPWPADIDDDDVVNDWIHAQHAGRSPEALVGEYDASYDRLIAAIESVPEAVFADPDAAPWAGGALADGDFTGHFRDEHLTPLREWLDRSR